MGSEPWFPVRLTGERVILRRHLPENIEAFRRWYADARIARLTRYQDGPMRPLEIERFFLSRAMGPDSLAMAVHLRGSGRLIGTCAFSQLDGDNGSALFHITIGETIAVRLSDPAEQELPEIGLAVVQDAETGEQMFIDTGDRGVRKRFAMAAERREAELRTALTQALIDVPGNVVVTRALAVAEEGAGDLQGAYDRLDAAIRQHPADVGLRRALAGLLRRADEASEAVRILAPLLDGDSVPAEIYDDFALALDAAGEAADAENARQIAQRLREGVAMGGVDGEGDQ